jgi:hypothetical protein
MTDPVLGHGNISFPPPLFGDFDPTHQKLDLATFYVIDQNEFVAIGAIDLNPGTMFPGVMFFDPQ